MLTESQNSNRGFSLIEVLVAVTIVGIALPALLFSMMQRLDGTAYMRERMIASWVAVNVLTELHIANLEDGKIPADGSTGSTEMASVRWDWELRVQDTSVPNQHKVEVMVWQTDAESQRILSTIETFLQNFHKIRDESVAFKYDELRKRYWAKKSWDD